MHFERCTFVRSVDGDTYDILVPVNHMSPEQPVWTPRIRCAKLNTPERGKPGYAEAKKALEDRLRGQSLAIETFGRDSFQRLIAETYIGTTGEVFSAWMLAQGWAAYESIRLQLSK